MGIVGGLSQPTLVSGRRNQLVEERRAAYQRLLFIALFVWPPFGVLDVLGARLWHHEQSVPGLITLRIISLIHWHAFLLWLKRVPWFAKAARPADQRGLYRPHTSLVPAATGSAEPSALGRAFLSAVALAKAERPTFQATVGDKPRPTTARTSVTDPTPDTA